MDKPETSSAADNQRRLDVLLRAYEIERTEDSEAWGVSLGLVAASVAMMSLIGFALVNASRGVIPLWLVALLPLGPLPFIAFGALHSLVSQVRGAVIDLYEDELRRLVPDPVLPAPSGHSIAMKIWVGGYGRIAIGIATVSYVAMYVVVLVQSFRYSHHAYPTLAFTSLIASGVSTAILAAVVARSFDARRLPDGALEDLVAAQTPE